MNNGPETSGSERLRAKGGAVHDDPELEAALRRVLQRTDVPTGFADRVLAEAMTGVPRATSSYPLRRQQAKLLHWPQRRVWITGAIAAALVLGALEGGLAWQHVREQQRRIRDATQQFQTSERITVHALAQAREQLQRAGVPLLD